MRIFLLCLCFLSSICWLTSSAKASDIMTIITWGQQGNGAGEFNEPRDIALDAQGNVYVADFRNHRFQKFTAEGNFLMAIGGEGDGPLQFKDPCGIDVDISGKIYIADTWNHRIQIINPDGTLHKILTPGLFAPKGIKITNTGNIYISDTGGGRIVILNSQGNFLATFGEHGTSAGQFKDPIGISVNNEGEIAVCDILNWRIQLFSPQYKFLRKWEISEMIEGFKDSFLDYDKDGNIVVSDTLYHRIKVFSPSGKLLYAFGAQGKAPGEFNSPTGIATAKNGGIYITDTWNHRIQYFPPEFLASIKKPAESVKIEGISEGGRKALKKLISLLVILIALFLLIKTRKKWKVATKVERLYKGAKVVEPPYTEFLAGDLPIIPFKNPKLTFILILLILVLSFLSSFFLNYPSLFIFGILVFFLIIFLAILIAIKSKPSNNISLGIDFHFTRAILAMIFILILAFYFRFYKLGELPKGISQNEAQLGISVLRFLEGLPLATIISEKGILDAFFSILSAIAVLLFGETPFALRMVPCLLGTFSVLAVYFVAKLIFSSRSALVSSLSFALFLPAIMSSRTCESLIFLVFWLIASFYFLLSAGIRQRDKDLLKLGVLSGFLFCFSFAGVVFLLLIIIYWIFLSINDKSFRQILIKRLLLFIIPFGMVIFLVIMLFPKDNFFSGNFYHLPAAEDSFSLLGTSILGNFWLILSFSGLFFCSPYLFNRRFFPVIMGGTLFLVYSLFAGNLFSVLSLISPFLSLGTGAFISISHQIIRRTKDTSLLFLWKIALIAFFGLGALQSMYSYFIAYPGTPYYQQVFSPQKSFLANEIRLLSSKYEILLSKELAEDWVVKFINFYAGNYHIQAMTNLNAPSFSVFNEKSAPLTYDHSRKICIIYQNTDPEIDKVEKFLLDNRFEYEVENLKYKDKAIGTVFKITLMQK